MPQSLIMSNYVLLCLIMSDLSAYATKTDLKNATGIDISSVAKKVRLANLNLMYINYILVNYKMLQLI